VTASFAEFSMKQFPAWGKTACAGPQLDRSFANDRSSNLAIHRTFFGLFVVLLIAGWGELPEGDSILP
jgi:hypothetical protein